MSNAKIVLVTGGAGFIGSHLCERLLQEGVRVICIDNFLTSQPSNISALMGNPDFRFLRLDLNQPFDLETFEELASWQIPFRGIQEIYHLACPMAIKRFDQFRIQTLLANSTATYHVLELATKYRAKVLLSSSSVIYGVRQNGNSLLREEDIGCVDHLSNRACYDEGRRFAETMCETYHQVHGIDVKIARLFRTYGSRMPLFDGHLIPDFVLNAIEGKDLVIYGDSSFSTSLCAVEDMIDGLFRVMASPLGTGPINLGSDVDVSMEDVAKMVIEFTESSSKITFESSLTFLSQLGLPDISKAKELGWLPLTRLEDGLRKTINDIRANKMFFSSLHPTDGV